MVNEYPQEYRKVGNDEKGILSKTEHKWLTMLFYLIRF